jgi:hypothetical protein
MPRLLLLPPVPFLRNSLFRLITGVSVKGRAILVDSLLPSKFTAVVLSFVDTPTRFISSSASSSSPLPFICAVPFRLFSNEERVLFLVALFGCVIISSSAFGVEKLIFRLPTFFFSVCGSAWRALLCFVREVIGAGSGATASVFVRFEPRVNLKSPSSSSYATTKSALRLVCRWVRYWCRCTT